MNLEELRWKKFPVLSDGFVTLVDVMGDDASVVQAARVSYGRDKRVNEEACKLVGDAPTTPQKVVDKFPEAEEKIKKEDRHLIRYLMRHRHTTPFEMAELKFLIRIPMDAWRQMIRHRTASVNEYSTRYAEAIDSMDVTPSDQWRLQSDSNRQGSSGFVEDAWPEQYQIEKFNSTREVNPSVPYMMPTSIKDSDKAGDFLTEQEKKFHEVARHIYEERLKFGVAREQARKDLPLSTFTEAYWKIDLHNLLGFLSLRMDGHAQKEIRDYATVIGEQIVKPLFPVVWEAFEDYRLGGMMLTAQEIRIIALFSNGDSWKTDKDSVIWPADWRGLEKCREREECLGKLKRLGIVR